MRVDDIGGIILSERLTYPLAEATLNSVISTTSGPSMTPVENRRARPDGERQPARPEANGTLAMRSPFADVDDHGIT
jgi:hypothetical protein